MYFSIPGRLYYCNLWHASGGTLENDFGKSGRVDLLDPLVWQACLETLLDRTPPVCPGSTILAQYTAPVVHGPHTVCM